MGNTTRDSESKIVLFLNWITASSTTVELCLREDHNNYYSDSRVGAFVRAMDRISAVWHMRVPGPMRAGWPAGVNVAIEICTITIWGLTITVPVAPCHEDSVRYIRWPFQSPPPSHQ